MTIQKMSRRRFFQGAALAGAGLASAGMLAACSQTGAEASSEAGGNRAWDDEADLVVLGSGCAGMYSAINAANAGMSVILLEKQPEETAGGDSRCNGGYLFAMDADLITDLAMGDCDEEWAFQISDEGANAIQWLLDNGCEWENQPYAFIKGNGPAVYECLLNAMNSTGATIRYSTPATSLIQNEQGEIIGVTAESEGAPLNIKAKKAVIVATGAYTCNKQLISDFHYPGLDLYSLSSPYLTGDGLLMAANLGARITKVSKGLEFDAFVSKAASEEIGTGIIMARPKTSSFIYVNGAGERFMDEYMNMQHSKTTLPCMDFSGSMQECRSKTAHYDNAAMWQIFDQACFDSGSIGNTASKTTWAIHRPDEGYTWSADNKAELEKGWILKADTIEELAGKTGIDPTALQGSVAAYNAGCEAGADTFNRQAESLAPLSEGPFYAVQLGISMLYTIGGLTTDAHGRTLNWNNKPIPRLYSAGNVGNAGVYLQPIAINGNMAQAAIAVHDIENLDAWDAA